MMLGMVPSVGILLLLLLLLIGADPSLLSLATPRLLACRIVHLSILGLVVLVDDLG